MASLTTLLKNSNPAINDAVMLGFPICPFVEAVRIVAQMGKIELNEKNVNIRNKSEWFVNINPYGDSTVPMLVIDYDDQSKTVINNTIALCDLLNDAGDIGLYSDDLIEKAHEQLWVNQLVPYMMHTYMMTLASTENEFESIRNEKLNPLLVLLNKQLEHQFKIKSGPCFNGDRVSMVDVMYAPQMMRYHVLKTGYQKDILQKFPAIQAWCDALITLPSVQAIIGDTTHFLALLKNLYEFKNSWLAGQCLSEIESVSAIDFCD